MSTPQNGSVAVTVKPGSAAEQVAQDPKVQAALKAAAEDLAKKKEGEVASVQVEKVGPEAAQPAGEQPAPTAEAPADPENPTDPEEVDEDADSGKDEPSTFLGLSGREWIIASVGILVGGAIVYAFVKIFADGSTETIDDGTGI